MTMERYQDVAEELLITIWDLAYPRVAKDWMTKVEKLVGAGLRLVLLLWTLSAAALESVLLMSLPLRMIFASSKVLLLLLFAIVVGHDEE